MRISSMTCLGVENIFMVALALALLLIRTYLQSDLVPLFPINALDQRTSFPALIYIYLK